MPRTVTKHDRALVAELRPQLIAAYTDDLMRQGLDQGSAKRIATKRFDNELANGRIVTASQEEVAAAKKKRFNPSEIVRKVRTAIALKLIAPKGGTR